MVQENAAHADQAIIADFATVEDGAVADGHVIAELQGGIQTDVEDGVILNIGVAADRHFIDIGAQDGIEPDGGMILESNSTADDGPFCKEDFFAYDGLAFEELFKGMAHGAGGMVCRFGKITGGFMRGMNLAGALSGQRVPQAGSRGSSEGRHQGEFNLPMRFNP